MDFTKVRFMQTCSIFKKLILNLLLNTDCVKQTIKVPKICLDRGNTFFSDIVFLESYIYFYEGKVLIILVFVFSIFSLHVSAILPIQNIFIRAKIKNSGGNYPTRKNTDFLNISNCCSYKEKIFAIDFNLLSFI